MLNTSFPVSDNGDPALSPDDLHLTPISPTSVLSSFPAIGGCQYIGPHATVGASRFARWASMTVIAPLRTPLIQSARQLSRMTHDTDPANRQIPYTFESRGHGHGHSVSITRSRFCRNNEIE